MFFKIFQARFDLCNGLCECVWGEGRMHTNRAPQYRMGYCGRAFRMAFTSSATAVRANSNWSYKDTKNNYAQFLYLYISLQLPTLVGWSLDTSYTTRLQWLVYLGAHHTGSLVTNVLQCCSNINLLNSYKQSDNQWAWHTWSKISTFRLWVVLPVVHTFCHSVQDHVN